MATEIGEALNQHLDDPAFPCLTDRPGGSGEVVPVLRGTGLRVQTPLVAAQTWRLSPLALVALGITWDTHKTWHVDEISGRD